MIRDLNHERPKLNMASSKKDNPEDREELLDIVFDMIMEGESKEDIITTLQESGLEEEEAESVYEEIEERYESQLGTQVKKRVEELFEERKENIMKRMDAKVQDLKDDVETKREFTKSEQKEYTDKKFKELESELEDLKDQLFDLNSEVKSNYEELSNKLKGLQPSSWTAKLGSIALVLIGGIIIAYSILNVNATQILSQGKITKRLMQIALEVILVFTGIILIKFGKDIHSSSKGNLKTSESHSWVEE